MKYPPPQTFENYLRTTTQQHPQSQGDLNENIKSIQTVQKDTNCKSINKREYQNLSEFSEPREFDLIQQSQEKNVAQINQF